VIVIEDGGGLHINGTEVPRVASYTITHRAGDLPRVSIECIVPDHDGTATRKNVAATFAAANVHVVFLEPLKAESMAQELLSELTAVIARHTAREITE